MALPSVTFNINQSGLGRALPGEDHISGLVSYAGSLPSGFGTDREKVVFSLQEAEALGITEGSADFDHLWYQIREYFRIQASGVLYLSINAVPSGSYTFDEVSTLQNFAEGKIRQVAVLSPKAGVNTTDIATLAAICRTLESENMPLVSLISFDISGTSDLSSLPDLRQSTTDNHVSVVIGQDGGAKGKALYDSKSVSIPCLGAVLGAVSLAAVNESIGWVSKFKLSETELDTIAFGNGDTYISKSQSFLTSLDAKGYIFLLKHTGISGSYLNGSHTAISSVSDLSTIEKNRVIQKAVRTVRVYLLGELNAPVKIDSSSGKLSLSYITYLEALGAQALNAMEAEDEISGYEVLIDPDQNVLSTDEVEVTIRKVPTGVSRTITVNIGFTNSIS